MTDILSTADIRRFLNVHLKKGETKNPYAAIGRELPARAFAKAVAVHWTDLHRMRDGKIPIGQRARRNLSRFIRDWENGMLEFGYGTGKYHSARILIHRQTPKPRAITMAVSWDKGAKLSILPRPAANPRIPHFKDLFAGLTKR